MALYHHHRPQTFASIVGQDHIVKTITHQIGAGTVAHAYLFSGPRGVGKTTTARLIAKAVNCPLLPGTAEPDNASPEAQAITAGKSIDVIEIDAASHTGVDHVREHIIENAQFRPTTLAKKVFIIDEVHMLSTSAFNALLKTLEEPPEYVIFILATTELHKLPETIVSRCQHFQFTRVPHDTIVAHLEHIAKEEGISVDRDVLNRLAAKSDGCVRDAVSLLEQIMATGEKEITADTAALLLPPSARQEAITFLEALLDMRTAPALEVIHTLWNHGGNLFQFTDDLVSLLRSVLLLHIDSDAIEHHAYDNESREKLNALCTASSAQRILHLTDKLLARRNMMKHTSLSTLPLELLVVEWCTENRADHTPPPPSPQHTPVHTEPIRKKEEKKKITTRVKEMVHGGPEITREQVDRAWPAFLASVEAHSPSLVFLLRMARIEATAGHTVTISVEFAFHKDKLVDPACSRELERLLSEALGSAATLDVVVTAPRATADEPSQDMQELAAAFGGEIVH